MNYMTYLLFKEPCIRGESPLLSVKTPREHREGYRRGNFALRSTRTLSLIILALNMQTNLPILYREPVRDLR